MCIRLYENAFWANDRTHELDPATIRVLCLTGVFSVYAVVKEENTSDAIVTCAAFVSHDSGKDWILEYLATHVAYRGVGYARCMLKHLQGVLPGGFSLACTSDKEIFYAGSGMVLVRNAFLWNDTSFQIHFSGKENIPATRLLTKQYRRRWRIFENLDRFIKTAPIFAGSSDVLRIPHSKSTPIYTPPCWRGSRSGKNM